MSGSSSCRSTAAPTVRSARLHQHGREHPPSAILDQRESKLKLLLVVAAALVDRDGRILVAQRPAGRSLAGLWEFPGGKVEAGERPEQALARELHEELGLQVDERLLQPLTFASHAYPDLHLLMPLFLCRQWQGEAQGREGQALRWLPPRDLRGLPMPPADAPLIDVLAAALAS